MTQPAQITETSDVAIEGMLHDVLLGWLKSEVPSSEKLAGAYIILSGWTVDVGEPIDRDAMAAALDVADAAPLLRKLKARNVVDVKPVFTDKGRPATEYVYAPLGDLVATMPAQAAPIARSDDAPKVGEEPLEPVQ